MIALVRPPRSILVEKNSHTERDLRKLLLYRGRFLKSTVIQKRLKENLQYRLLLHRRLFEIDLSIKKRHQKKINNIALERVGRSKGRTIDKMRRDKKYFYISISFQKERVIMRSQTKFFPSRKKDFGGLKIFGGYYTPEIIRRTRLLFIFFLFVCRWRDVLISERIFQDICSLLYIESACGSEPVFSIVYGERIRFVEKNSSQIYLRSTLERLRDTWWEI